MKARIASISIAAVIAVLVWVPLSNQVVNSIYCYPGDPPDVYQACLAYNAGLKQQASNQQQMEYLLHHISDIQTQINSTYAFIKSINSQIDTQNALIAQTKARIADIQRQVRFRVADLVRLQADVAVRDQLLGQRMRFVDAHGPINYVELILTAASFNDLVNRMIGAQQVASSDRQLLDQLSMQNAQVTVAQEELSIQQDQVTALLQQQQTFEGELQKNKGIQTAALALATQLENTLAAQYYQLQAQRAAIDAEVAALMQQYDAAAAAHGGGTGVFTWPEPACTFSCISQGFGCSAYYFEIYDPSCPYPHRIHTGIDIAGPDGTQIVAADTGIAYLYPGSFGYGNMIIMINGHGYSTFYAHLQGYAPGLQSGEIVPRGTTIGFEGSTGNSTGPHLHFEIRVNNVYKDPCIWLGC